ncbi:MAG: lipoate--protein ligase family protein [Thermaerobacter sp.]|nr:lipoate--protein ligase family protein [Thermaerobacter sp.]
MRFLDATQDDALLRLSPSLAEAVATAVAAGESPPTFGLRRQRPYVLLGPQDLRLPRIAEGAAWLEAQGLPVHQRVGGGAAVLLDDGCLSFFAAIPTQDISRLDDNFRTLTLPVRSALQKLGVSVEFGRAPGSFCEGPQDLVSGGGRKIAGVSQALRRGYALVSGMLLVRQDPVATTALLQEFYRRSGSGRQLRASAVTSLEAELGREVPLAELRPAIVRAAGEVGWDTDLGEIQPFELAQAKTLLALRRFAPPARSAQI